MLGVLDHGAEVWWYQWSEEDREEEETAPLSWFSENLASYWNKHGTNIRMCNYLGNVNHFSLHHLEQPKRVEIEQTEF